MHKNVRAVSLLDETETFCIAEPLYCSFYHFTSPSVCSLWISFSRFIQKKALQLISSGPLNSKFSQHVAVYADIQQ
jgi:hypothetical protein